MPYDDGIPTHSPSKPHPAHYTPTASATITQISPYHCYVTMNMRLLWRLYYTQAAAAAVVVNSSAQPHQMEYPNNQVRHKNIYIKFISRLDRN